MNLRSVRRWLIAIVVLAIALRLVAALVLGDRAEPISGAYDQVSYDALAQRLVTGHGFSFAEDSYPFLKANEPTAHWSFLYTLYLAVVYAVFGHHPLAARLIQVLLSGLGIWLAYRIGRRLFGEWVGLAAAALTAGYAYLIFFNAALMTQTFYIIAVLAALELAMELAPQGLPTVGIAKSVPQRTRDLRPLRFAARIYDFAPKLGIWKDELWKWGALGVVLGVGVLLRQTLLLFAPVLFLWIVWRRRRGAAASRELGAVGWERSTAAGIAIAAVVIASLVLPWTVRNYLVYHDFLLLNSNGGFWFYSSNHPNQGTNFEANYVAPIPDNLKGLSEPAIDRALYSEALGFVLSDPKRFVLLSLNRTKDYFWLTPSEQSSLMSNLGRVFSFTLYLPFMLYGLFLSRGRWRECLPLYLYAGFDTALCLISWSAPRYRLPTDAVMMPFAGLAVVDVVGRVRRKE